MSRKALRIVVVIEIQAVTCPGVWLCPNGKVQVLFSMLGQEVQTRKLPPVFPLIFHEKLSFHKTFTQAGCLAEVQEALGREDVFAVLLQETKHSTLQLARFHSTSLQILYPSPCSKGLLAGVDVDLLMEASADFPGILAPKIELSTKTTLEEVTNLKPNVYVINPKTLCSQRRIVPTCRKGTHESKAVQSDGRHRRQSSNPSRAAKYYGHDLSGPDNVHLRSAPIPHRAICTKGPRTETSPIQKVSSWHAGKSGFKDDFTGLCQCGTGHSSMKCPLCTRYKAIFNSPADDETIGESDASYIGNKQSYMNQCANTKRLSNALHAHVNRVLQPATNNLFCDGEQCQSGCNIYKPNDNSELGTKQQLPGSRSVNSKPSGLQNEGLAKEFTHKTAYRSDPESQASCGSGDDCGSYRHLFYTNLEKFYRKLYLRARNRMQEENQTSTA